MLYMYASMEFRWTWLPAALQAGAFALSTVAISIWMLCRFVGRKPFSYLWLPVLIMQGAMAYMWLPTWVPAITWLLVGYHVTEACAWLLGVVDDTPGGRGIGPVTRLM